MRTREDIESYLMRAGMHYQEVGEEEDADMWIVSDTASGENIVIRMAGPLVLFRVKVMEIERVKEKLKLYEQLLRYNASDMVHGNYGIAEGNVVLTCALRLQNLDYNEFQGTIDDFSLALTNHYETLASFQDAA